MRRSRSACRKDGEIPDQNSLQPIAMQLTEHRNENHLFVRMASAESVTVIDREFCRSIMLSASQVVDDLAVNGIEDFDMVAADRILGWQPEVVLLGTGARAKFPPQRIQAAFLRHGIGLETMDNAAAARTFNVLVAEGRNVVGVFLIDSANTQR